MSRFDEVAVAYRATDHRLHGDVVVKVLECIGTAVARDLLQDLSAGPPARLAQEARAALERLGKLEARAALERLGKLQGAK